MAHHMILNKMQAIAQTETAEILEGLIPGEPSDRLYRAKNERFATHDFRQGVMLAELAQIVADQQKRIEKLEKAVKSTGKKASGGTDEKAKERKG